VARGGWSSGLRSAILAHTCQILARDRNSYVDVFKADTVARRMGVIDSRDGADASDPKSHRGLGEGDLFTHLKGFRLRIHRAPFTDPTRRQYTTSNSVFLPSPTLPLPQRSCTAYRVSAQQGAQRVWGKAMFPKHRAGWPGETVESSPGSSATHADAHAQRRMARWLSLVIVNS